VECVGLQGLASRTVLVQVTVEKLDLSEREIELLSELSVWGLEFVLKKFSV
jgi:hypothetical protein